MLIKYIDKSGNLAMLETSIDTAWESKVEKVGNTYFEKTESLLGENLPVQEEVALEEISLHEEIQEMEESVEDVAYDEQAMRDFLKEKSVRGYGLLKGESLKKKALEMGFNF